MPRSFSGVGGNEIRVKYVCASSTPLLMIFLGGSLPRNPKCQLQIITALYLRHVWKQNDLASSRHLLPRHSSPSVGNCFSSDLAWSISILGKPHLISLKNTFMEVSF